MDLCTVFVEWRNPFSIPWQKWLFESHWWNSSCYQKLTYFSISWKKLNYKIYIYIYLINIYKIFNILFSDELSENFISRKLWIIFNFFVLTPTVIFIFHRKSLVVRLSSAIIQHHRFENLALAPIKKVPRYFIGVFSKLWLTFFEMLTYFLRISYIYFIMNFGAHGLILEKIPQYSKFLRTM